MRRAYLKEREIASVCAELHQAHTLIFRSSPRHKGARSQAKQLRGALLMGASYGTTYVKTTESHADAYNTAVSVAHDQHGGDAYNGTISTTSGVKRLWQAAMSQKVAERFANSEPVVESLVKWGAAGALLVATDESFTRRTKKVRHVTSEVEYNIISKAILKAAEIEAAPGEHVESVTIVLDKPKWTLRNERTVVKPEIRYEVRLSGRVVEDGVFEKKAAAVAKAREVSKLWLQEGRGNNLLDTDGRPAWVRPAAITVHAVVKAGDTDQVCDFSPQLQSRTVTAEVVFAKAKSTVQNEGWLFCFWAAS